MKTPLPNLKGTALPQGCEVKQFISQEYESGQYLTFTVDKDIFDAMDDFSKAMTLIHEALYKDLTWIRTFLADAIGFTKFLISVPSVKTMSRDEKLQWWAKNLRVRSQNLLPSAQYRDFEISFRYPMACQDLRTPPYEFYEAPHNNALKTAFLEITPITLKENQQTVRVGGKTHLYLNGQIQKTQLLSTDPLNIEINKTPFSCTNSLSFTPSGALNYCD